MNITLTRPMADILIFMRTHGEAIVQGGRRRRRPYVTYRTPGVSWRSSTYIDRCDLDALIKAKLLTRLPAPKEYVLTDLGRQVVIPPVAFLDGWAVEFE